MASGNPPHQSITPMSAEEVLQQGLALDPEQREIVAHKLLASVLNELGDPEIEKAWMEEVHRRIARAEVGQSKMIPYEEITRELADLRKPTA